MTRPTDARLAAGRAGFTMIELLVVLVVAAALAGMAWTLAQVGTSLHRSELRRADAERTRRNVESAVGRALEQAARDGISAPNLGMLRASAATSPDGSPADTLLVLRTTGVALPVASRPCRAGAPGSCIALRGDRTGALRPGTLLVVGSARIGYRLLLAGAVQPAYAAPCGADCVPAAFCPVTLVRGVAVTEVIAGTLAPGGTTAPSCAESYYPDGSRCVETRAVRAAAPRARSACAPAGTSALYTDVATTDLTAALGFPAPREWSGVSGGGSPAVAAMPVEPARFWTAPDGAERALLLQRGLTAGGDWTPARRVAGPLASLQVEAAHEDAAGWSRGDGVDGAGLASSPNRSAASSPEAGAVGYTYARGYHTLVAVRVTVAVVGTSTQGARTTQVVRIVQSLAPVARGGAREAQ
ncbi:MAG: hypothetical protein JWM27_4898 [Gemmatimonadetes bacterium]|nr:hypothetical protein [Gemmatimonadota bacterium]